MRKRLNQTLHYLRQDTGVWFLLLLFLGILLRFEQNPSYIDWDVAMNVNIGWRILEGDRPQVDYDEINLPTNHYLNTIPAGLVRFLEVPPVAALRLFVLSLLLYGILMSKWLTRSMFDLPLLVNLTLASVLYISFNIAVGDFGQREHVFVLLILPWLFLRLRRMAGLAEGRVVAVVVGFIAALAFSIKPFFTLVFFITEAYIGVAHYRGNLKRYLSQPEWAGFVAFCLLYVGYFLLNLDVLQAMLNSLRFTAEGYDSHGSRPFIETFFGSSIAWFMFILAALSLFYWRRDIYRDAFILFTLACFAGLLAVALQRRGYNYHFLPFNMFGAVALGIGLLSLLVSHKERQALNRLFTIALSLILLWYLALQVPQRFDNDYVDAMAKAVTEISQVDDKILIYETWPAIYRTTVPERRWQASFHILSHGIPFAIFKYGTEEAAMASPEMSAYLEKLVLELETGYPAIFTSQFMYEFFNRQGYLSQYILPRYRLHYIDRLGAHAYAYVGEPPTSPPLFNWNDELLLLGVSLPDPSQYQACQTVPIKSWWELQAERPLRAQQTDYYVSFILQQQGQVLVKQEAQLLRVSEADGQQVYAYQLDLSIPCDASAGDYDLVMALAAVVPAEEDHTPRPVEALGLGAYPYLRSVSISTP